MIKFFIEKNMAVFSLALLIAIIGVMAYFSLPRESSPEIQQPYIFVTTTYPGVSASDIESLVTQRIEDNLEGMNGLSELTSESRANVSFIFAEFSSDVSVDEALRRTKDRVDQAVADLPADANEPNVREFSVSDWPIFRVVVSHPEGVQVIEQAAENLREELERLNGVLEVEIAGNPARELAVELDPFRMAAYGFSINDVESAVQREHVSIPGGSLQSSEKNYALAVTGEISDPAEFGRITVAAKGVQVHLSELAEVAFKNADDETLSRYNGKPAITLSIKKRLGANILELADAAQARLDELQPELPAGTELTVSYDESQYIRDMIEDLENNMATGFVLVLLVTIFFLGLRNSLFVSMAIPMSMLLSFFVLQLLGVTLNMIVLFSLILALGMLVDNGIVIVENIFRHAAMGKDRVQAAIEGTGEVAMAIAASTLTTILAFFPIIFMPGIMGDFMSYLPITVIVVLSSSLFVALVINPVFCARFLNVNERQRRKMQEGSGVFIRLQHSYTRLLEKATRHAGKTVLGVTVLVVTGFVVFGLIGADILFFPEIDPERARIRVEAPHGTPLEQTNLIVREIEEFIPDVSMSLSGFEAVAGRDGGDTESHLGMIDITFAAFAEREIRGSEAVRNLQERLREVTSAVTRVQESDGGPPTGDDLSYEVRGPDYATLGDIAAQIRAVLEPHAPRFRELDNDFEESLPEYGVEIDRQRAAHHGLTTQQVASTVRAAFTGSTVGAFRIDDDEYDINVRYRDDARDSLQTLRNLQVVTPDARRIPLSSVAEVRPRSTVSVIKRRNLNRAVNVWANFQPDTQNRSQITTEIEGEIAELKEALPDGYTIGAGAGFDVRDESTNFLEQAFLVALFLIFVVLIAQFNSLADPMIILYAVFLSLGGVFWGFALSGQNFVVIMSGIGSIALAGVAVNNCIVLVDYTHLLIRDGMPWRDAVVEAGKVRLRPVVLTALTTVLALVPMAVGVSFSVHELSVVLGSESAEYWKAFAWTMLFGLSFATVTTLVVVPALLSLKYRLIERRKGADAVA